MNRNFYAVMLRNITAACLAMVILTTSSMIALAGTDKKSLMGEITVSGQAANGGAASVMLNGESAFTGRTFFSSGTIATPENVNSTVSLGKLGSINLSPNTTLSLSFDEKTISGNLSAGQIRVFNAEGIEVKIQTNAGLVTNESNLAKSFTVNAEKASRQDDDDKNDGTDGNSPLGPILVFSGIVATAVILVLVYNNDDEDSVAISPIR
jgi:hypothetical protein